MVAPSRSAAVDGNDDGVGDAGAARLDNSNFARAGIRRHQPPSDTKENIKNAEQDEESRGRNSDRQER